MIKEIIRLFMSEKLVATWTVFLGASIVVCLTLMGWKCSQYPPPKPAAFLQADKGEVIRLTPAAMAEAAYRYNKKQEEIARVKQ